MGVSTEESLSKRWSRARPAAPIPFTSFLLKIATRCNLDCDYCYVYRGPDQSWRTKPKFMTPQVADAAIERIAEHVRSHNIAWVSVALHGGEPLLAGLDLIDHIFTSARSTIPCEVELGMQSNLTLLTQETIDLFYCHRATIGVSLDGDRSANDRHRLDLSGRSSFDKIEANLELLCSTDRGSHVFSGMLAVVDLRNEPAEVFDYLNTFSPRSLDLLLPDGTHEIYPPGKRSFEDTPYGDWLIRLFDHWWCERSSEPPIRLFDNIITLLLGGSCDTEYLGVQPVDLLVIESDGSLEAVDTLKIAYDGAPALGKSIVDTTLDEIQAHPAVASRMAGAMSRADECQNCRLLNVCGGGYLPHRFSTNRGFVNPSVYCHDLAKLILHIRRSVLRHQRQTRTSSNP